MEQDRNAIEPESREPVSSTPDVEDTLVDASENTGESLKDDIVAVLKTVYDPEIPVDIYELGLVYDVTVRENADVKIVMTLTTPMCPVAETLPVEVEDKVRSVEGVANVSLDLVWDPPWNPDMMSEAAKLTLNF